MAKNITIKKLDALSVGKLLGTVNIIIAVAVGLIASIVTVISVVTNNTYDVGMDILVSIGIIIAGIIVYPLFMYAVGWIYGALVGFIFNVVIGVSGGINLTVEDEAKR